MAFPGTYNFDYYRGDTHQMVINPKTSTGANFDLANYTAAYTVASTRGSGGVQYEQTATVDTLLDTITCTITSEDGRLLIPGTYVYDVQISDSLVPPTIFTVLTGTIIVTDDITGAV